MEVIFAQEMSFWNLKNVIIVHFIKQMHQYVFKEHNTYVKLKNKRPLFSFDCQFYD